VYKEIHELIPTIKDRIYQNIVPAEMLFTQLIYLFYFLIVSLLLQEQLCIVARGGKDVWLAHENFRYVPANYFVASVDLLVTGQVMQASSDFPYLSLKLEFIPSKILEALSDFEH
jgi:hypothetical protein